ncbi:MAG: ABC transporter ATP-binding protein [Rickettsiales bacterium]|jgi:lipoprotein-releasing system ATP-binding protein
MSKSVLQLTNISKTYQQAESVLTVLSNLNLEVKAGEVVALVGQSGSGKTTLLQIAGLLDNPTSGIVAISGEDLSKANDKKRTLMRRKNIGFIYQFHHLLPEFSALENVVLPQMIAGMERSKAEEKAMLLLAELGLAQRLEHRPAKLSGGEQQRVAVARALANNPAIVLADEPTGNLDPATADSVFAMFMNLAKERGQSALVATHNIELAKRMDRIVRLEGGVLRWVS